MTNPLVTISVKRTYGTGRGKKIGLPTINFVIPSDLRLPYGIYAGWLIIGDQKYPSAIHFGPRPQFHESGPSLEAYILNQQFVGTNVNIELQFVKFLRQIKRFASLSKMLDRIEIDISEVKNNLFTSSNPS